MLPAARRCGGGATAVGTSPEPSRQNGAMDADARSPELTQPADAVTEEVRAERRKALEDLIGLMRPAVQADGGDLVLVDADVDTGVVEVELRGACSSCAISSATLQGGVERILRDRLDWVTEVRGGVDEADVEVGLSIGRGGYVPRW